MTHSLLSRSFELFYQLGLRQFGAIGMIEIEDHLAIRDLAQIGVDAEREEIVEAGLDPEAVIKVCLLRRLCPSLD